MQDGEGEYAESLFPTPHEDCFVSTERCHSPVPFTISVCVATKQSTEKFLPNTAFLRSDPLNNLFNKSIPGFMNDKQVNKSPED